MVEGHCGECAYWDMIEARERNGGSYSACHANPPSLPANAKDREGVWPIVPDYGWCGKFTEAERELEPRTPTPCPVCGIATWKKYDHFQKAHPEYKIVRLSAGSRPPSSALATWGHGGPYTQTRYSCGVCGKQVPNFTQMVKEHRHTENDV